MSVLTICSGCRSEVSPGARFCSSCGLATDAPVQPDLAVPAAPVQGPVGTAPARSASKLKALALAALASMLMGALVSHLQAAPTPTERKIVARGSIGPQGGTVAFDDGGKVEIPAGAVDEVEEIVVYRTVIEEEVSLTPPLATAPIVFPAGTLVVYSFGPFNLTFLQPITIVLPVPAGLVGQVFVSANGRFQFISGLAVGNTVVIQVSGFGNGFLIVN